MNNAEKVIDAVKNGYVWSIDAIERHPHFVFWTIAVLSVWALVETFR